MQSDSASNTRQKYNTKTFRKKNMTKLVGNNDGDYYVGVTSGNKGRMNRITN